MYYNENNYKNILGFFESEFKELIVENLEESIRGNKKYQDILHFESELLEDNKFLEEIICQRNKKDIIIPCDKVYILNDYLELNENKKTELMKKCYFQGIKDTMLFLTRSRLFEKS